MDELGKQCHSKVVTGNFSPQTQVYKKSDFLIT